MITLCILLCACPYSSVYTLDDEPGVYVEDVLLGKWATMVKKPGPLFVKPGMEKYEPVKMILTKKTETEYNIVFIGYADELRRYKVFSADSVKGTAFTSIIDGRQFMNIRIGSQIYIAELNYKNDKLSLFPLVEHFTAKMITNNEALRNSVSYHYKTRVHPMVDEDFCLKDMVRVK